MCLCVELVQATSFVQTHSQQQYYIIETKQVAHVYLFISHICSHQVKTVYKNCVLINIYIQYDHSQQKHAVIFFLSRIIFISHFFTMTKDNSNIIKRQYKGKRTLQCLHTVTSTHISRSIVERKQVSVGKEVIFKLVQFTLLVTCCTKHNNNITILVRFT